MKCRALCGLIFSGEKFKMSLFYCMCVLHRASWPALWVLNLRYINRGWMWVYSGSNAMA